MKKKRKKIIRLIVFFPVVHSFSFFFSLFLFLLSVSTIIGTFSRKRKIALERTQRKEQQTFFFATFLRFRLIKTQHITRL